MIISLYAPDLYPGILYYSWKFNVDPVLSGIIIKKFLDKYQADNNLVYTL